MKRKKKDASAQTVDPRQFQFPGWQSVLAAAALGLLAFLAYSNSFSAGFILDNKGLLLQDPRIRELTGENIRLILQHTYWWPSGEAGLYRPFTTLSYLFNYAVLGNADAPAGYHWINFLLHLGNVILVYALARRLLASDYLSSDSAGPDCAEQSSAAIDSQSFALRNPKERNPKVSNPEVRNPGEGPQSFALRNPEVRNPKVSNPEVRNPGEGPQSFALRNPEVRNPAGRNPGKGTAFFVAALWAVHPVLTESVTNMIGRSDLLSAMAVLGGFLMYLKSTESAGLRRLAWLAGLMAVTAVGVFSKESSVVIVGVIALYELSWWSANRWPQSCALRNPKERKPARVLLSGCIATLVPIAAMLYQRSIVLAASRPAEFPFT